MQFCYEPCSLSYSACNCSLYSLCRCVAGWQIGGVMLESHCVVMEGDREWEKWGRGTSGVVLRACRRVSANSL